MWTYWFEYSFSVCFFANSIEVPYRSTSSSSSFSIKRFRKTNNTLNLRHTGRIQRRPGGIHSSRPKLVTARRQRRPSKTSGPERRAPHLLICNWEFAVEHLVTRGRALAIVARLLISQLVRQVSPRSLITDTK